MEPQIQKANVPCLLTPQFVALEPIRRGRGLDERDSPNPNRNQMTVFTKCLRVLSFNVPF